jgi:DNA-binding response OmpR family regulator
MQLPYELIMGKKILVVDDDKDILEAISFMLDAHGFQVETDSGGTVEKRIEEYSPNLLLLDMLLSGKDGRDITRKLKSETATKGLPIIMISAHPTAEKTIRESGADDFLAKPFEMDELIKRINKYI